MTNRGRLTPINRNGINRIPNISALRKSSFEETVEILYDAAIFSEKDDVIFFLNFLLYKKHFPPIIS